MIEIRLFATLRENRGKILHFEADGLHTATDILLRLSIEPADVAILLINGIHSKPENSVKDEDIIALFPPVGGG
ncbi:MAG: MoaD/ThiS family protein [Erysipelotrichaceae bacterium]